MLTLKTKSILSAHVMKTRWLVVRKCVDDLMFHSEESNEAFRLQNNTVYAVQSFQFKRTYLLCLHKTTHELQKTSFKQFKNPRNPKIWVHVQELCIHVTYTDTIVQAIVPTLNLPREEASGTSSAI